MTVPMPAAAPSAIRPGGTPSASDTGGTDSAEPFASALDGALAGRSEADGAGAQAGGATPAAQEEPRRPDRRDDDPGGSGPRRSPA